MPSIKFECRNMFLSPSFLSKGFLLFGDILQGSSIGDCLSVKDQGGREETYWRLVTFYYNPHCTILSGEMDLWNFKLKTRDLVLVLKAPYDSLKFAEKSIFYCYFEQNMHRIYALHPYTLYMSLPMLGSH